MIGYVLYFVLGLIIGTLAALFGLGGGFLIVPLLNISGVEIHQAIGTSSAAIVFTSLSSAIAYARQRRIRYKIGALITGTAIFGAYIGAYLTSFVDPGPLKVIFGAVLTFVALRMFISAERHSKGEEKTKEMKLWTAPLIGVLSGVASGFLGIGGGIVIVPSLTYLGIPIHYAVATSSFCIVFTSISSALKHYTMGNVLVHWLIFLVPGLIIGAQLGPRIAKRMKSKTLKRAFSIVMGVLALRMILKGLGFPVP
ncbi:MAG: sulfite exporter TauE/SafE family protein [Euryarchaeota archaeon]|nr:sulfite exporter TauE/SafE family protein [Euryarchaeota archaeon]